MINRDQPNYRPKLLSFEILSELDVYLHHFTCRKYFSLLEIEHDCVTIYRENRENGGKTNKKTIFRQTEIRSETFPQHDNLSFCSYT